VSLLRAPCCLSGRPRTRHGAGRCARLCRRFGRHASGLAPMSLYARCTRAQGPDASSPASATHRQPRRTRTPEYNTVLPHHAAHVDTRQMKKAGTDSTAVRACVRCATHCGDACCGPLADSVPLAGESRRRRRLCYRSTVCVQRHSHRSAVRRSRGECTERRR